MIKNLPIKILVSAGEVSGDEHAAQVIKAYLELNPAAQIFGMGGRKLRALGVETIIDSETSASVMGIQELFGGISKVLAALKSMKNLLVTRKPDALLVVDFAEFNMSLAKRAAKLGIPVLYFIPPQVWAWRSGRVELLKKYTKALAVIFPFEEQFLYSKGYKDVYYVGHPLVNSEKLKISAETPERIRESLELEKTQKLLSIFPGSRNSEIKKHLAPAIAGAEIFLKKHPEVAVVICLAPGIRRELVQAAIPPSSKIKIYESDSVMLMQSSDAALIKSGTSNLQAAFAGLPFSMFYQVGIISELVGRTFVKTKEFSIVNVIRTNTVRELLQKEVNPETIAFELERLVFDSSYQEKIKQGLSEVRNSLTSFSQDTLFSGTNSSYQRVALLLEKIISNKDAV